MGLAIRPIVARSDLETNFVTDLRFLIDPDVCGERGLSSAEGAATGDPLAAQARPFSNLSTDCRDLYTDLLNMFSGYWRWGMLAVIWSLAAVGILVKLFVIHAPRWINAGVYLVMGWISLLLSKKS